MPRTARIKNETSYYHIMLRAINRQSIFEDPKDKLKFLDILADYKTQLDFELLAYCIMDNHVHLVIHVNEAPLDVIFRKINTSFASDFNKRHERCGHLFQDRYKSEPITTEMQLLRTIRYVHFNPIKAGLCAAPDDYGFSSYKDYIYYKSSKLCDKDAVIKMMGGIDSFIAFHEKTDDNEYMDIKDSPKYLLRDEEARAILNQVCENAQVDSLLGTKRSKRDPLIRELRKKHLSIRQISRLTGLSLDIVKKASTGGGQ